MAQDKIDTSAQREAERALLDGRTYPDKILPAMPIRVEFSPSERLISMERHSQETVFRFRVPDNSSVRSGLYWADAYRIRDWFERIETPEEAFRFLHFVGIFRCLNSPSPDDSLTWSEFVRWQFIVRRIRLRKPWDSALLLLSQDEEGREFLLTNRTIEGLCPPNEFSETVDQFIKVSEDTFNWLRGIPTGLTIWRDKYLSRAEIEEIFSTLESRESGSKEWQEAQATLQIRRDERARGNADGKQKLMAKIFAVSALDAILATTFIDQLRGVETQVCALKGCEKIFEISTKHARQYCSQACAHKASVYRKRAERKSTAKSGKPMRAKKVRK